MRSEVINTGNETKFSSSLPADLTTRTLLGKVHIEVHTEMPSTLILPDWEHLR